MCKIVTVMGEHRYILEPYRSMNSRHRCPGCQHEHTFARYLDTETGAFLAPEVGRCNRENSCAYHYTPKQYFADNPTQRVALAQAAQRGTQRPAVMPPQQPPSFIDQETFKASLKGYENNNFARFLAARFGAKVADELVSRYSVGTSKKLWPGATVFWQIDTAGKVRGGKVMLYNETTGKRIKERITWVHKITDQSDYNLRQCLFGEHLLTDTGRPVAIVESEKTAMIASLYLPGFIWLACGGKEGLSNDKTKVLKGRGVVLYPDLGGFDKWSDKAAELTHIARVAVSDLLECQASDRERVEGLDLADYLLRFEPVEFSGRSQPTTPGPEPTAQADPLPAPTREAWHPAPPPVVSCWDIEELKRYFAGITLPTQPLRLNSYSIVENVQRYIQTNLAIAEAQNGKQTYKPYFDRLTELKEILSTNAN